MGKSGRLCVAVAALVLLAPVCSVFAQKHAYISIQGDKSMPFYVKLNGIMTSRYFKNHIVISKLDKGSYDLEILFEKSELPPLYFRIDVPEGGHRGFLLCRNNNAYTLYDLESKAWLEPGKK